MDLSNAPTPGLAMPAQRLDRVPIAPALPPDRWTVQAARVFVFGTALALTMALGFVLSDWFSAGGISWVEGGIIALGVAAAFWIALSVATAGLGLLPRTRRAPGHVAPLDIAVLLPLYGEAPQPIMRATRALLEGLAAAETPHRFSLHILSDTRDPAKVRAERIWAAMLQSALPGTPVCYRHRAENTRFKAGNIQEWVTRAGGAHDAMLVLDADSVMTPEAVLTLADTLGADPRLGLVQSIPRLIGAETLFARMQAFSNTVYGATLARGLAFWSGHAANYWGHNAIIRTRAFAASAGLPDLPGRRPFGGLILSHDFVEAALLRRAGWGVRFVPEAEGSFEGTPPSPIAHILRDRRWCQGNLQHLRLLTARGFHPLSRMHLLHGAVGYLSSVIWFALMVLWVLVGSGQGDGPIRYFSDANPLFPAWPEMELVSRILILTLIYGMLILPKVVGAIRFWASDPFLRSAGGPVRFLLSFVIEVVVSVALAPMMMVQHMIAVGRTLAGFDTGWKPASEGAPRFITCLRFHALELVLGLAMCGLFAAGLLTWWLIPIGVLLVLAPLLSWSLSAAPAWGMGLFGLPQDALVAAEERRETALVA